MTEAAKPEERFARVTAALSEINDPAYLSLSLGRVQRFIEGARRTEDLWAGSALISWLTFQAAEKLTAHNGVVLIPWLASHPFSALLPPGSPPSSTKPAGFPNRLWAVVPGNGADQFARRLEGELHDTWKNCLRSLGKNVDGTFPEIRCVLVTGAQDYAQAWQLAGDALGGRKRVRDFPAYKVDGDAVCSCCGLRAARRAPRLVGSYHLNPRAGEHLCDACMVKRVWREIAPSGLAPRFPSTAAVATAPFRHRVAAQVHNQEIRKALGNLVAQLVELKKAMHEFGEPFPDQLQEVIPGLSASGNELVQRFLGYDGEWCYPESWETATVAREYDLTDEQTQKIAPRLQKGREATKVLIDKMTKLEEPTPSRYLAVVMQDADDMGKALSGTPDPYGSSHVTLTPEWHAGVSHTLVELGASTYVDEIERGLGRLVYSGGDDLLAFLPVQNALKAAGTCRSALSNCFPRLTASTAVVFFHHSYPLQEALRRARELLEEAKHLPGKDRLAVLPLRRGGPRARGVLWWRGGQAATVLDELSQKFSDGGGRGLSPRLLRSLELEEEGLLGLSPARVESEVRRVVRRHGGDAQAEELVLQCWKWTERRTDWWLGALYTAHFIRQEG